MEVCGQIFKTYKYDSFKRMEGNRSLNRANLSKLRQSMAEEYLFDPIKVNEKFEVIDGQHRLAICKELGLPVYFHFTPGYGASEMKRLNTSGVKWNKQNFLESYVENGDDDYIEFESIIKKYDMSIGSLLKIIAYLNGGFPKQIADQFEDGLFELGDKELIVDFLDKLEDFSFFSCYKTDKFIAAFIKLNQHPNYQHQKMLKKLATHKDKLTKVSTMHEYLSLLCNKIYSYGATKEPIFYSSESKRFHQ